MCTRYPIINRVSELKVHIELTRFVQPENIEIDANERAHFYTLLSEESCVLRSFIPDQQRKTA